jgi:spore coat protein CotH
MIITLLLTACSNTEAELPSVDDTSVVLAQEAEPTTTSTAVDSERDTDTAEKIFRPEGWGEATHDKSADPNYDVVFPQDEVNRIDFVIDPADWQAMLDDMTALYGEAGTRAGGMGGGRMRPGGAQPEQGQLVPPAGQPGGGILRPGGNTPEGQAPPADQPFPMPPGGRPMEGPGGDKMMGSSVNPTYVPVTVEFEDDTWTNVGLRFKGNSSLRSTWGSGNMKLPLRLDFDQFEDEYPEIDDQRFYGFEQLTFSSGFSDASFLREKTTADIFREAGVPAAQTAFYQVYVNYGEGPIYFGLYTAVEVVDDTVIETQFEDDDGNVYKPEGTGASFAAGTFSEASFEKQTNEEEADWSDIQAIFDALHADTRMSDPVTWRNDLEAVFDVGNFLNWLAVNTVVQNWDTYGGMTHNYYLYHDPTTDQMIWIPWDNNEALSSGRGQRNVISLAMDEVGDDWPLIRYLLDDEVYYAQYVVYVDAVIDTAFEPAKMETTYRELAALIELYVLSENAEHTHLQSEADFYAAIEELVEHAYARYDAAAEFVAGQQ